jgi:acetoin utilization deacetylase AcuC-like enzyme
MFADLSKRFPVKERPFQLLGHPDCILHQPIADHPESKERLKVIMEGLLKLDPALALDFNIPKPTNISGLKIVHDRNYLMYLEEACLKQAEYFISRDNHISENSFAAILAAGGLSQALGKHMAEGGSGFALTRPPGHHAGRSSAEGFCFINNLAIALENIRQKHQDARFLVVDFDVHHGNGINNIYEHDENVFYFSMHGSPSHIYPGTGWDHENGQGKAQGNHLNITLNLGTSGELWLEKFNENLKAISEKCKPNFLLVSAGFDAHLDDPFSIMKVEDHHYEQCINSLIETAEKYCEKRMGLFLEGGYSLDVLGRIIPAIVSQLVKNYN